MTWKRIHVRAARQTPLKPVLEALGYQLEPRKANNYLVLGLAEEVIIKDHYWVCTDDGSAGNAIDFLVNIQGMTFSEGHAPTHLIDCSAIYDGFGNIVQPFRLDEARFNWPRSTEFVPQEVLPYDEHGNIPLLSTTSTGAKYDQSAEIRAISNRYNLETLYALKMIGNI